MLFNCVLGLAALLPMQPKDDYAERRNEYLKLYGEYKNVTDLHTFALAHSRSYNWHSHLDPVGVEALRVERERLRREMLTPRYAGFAEVNSSYFYLPWYFVPQYFHGSPGFWLWPGNPPTEAGPKLTRTAPGILELAP
jgi:hypothetical protein